jgi:hypothetical protein
LSPPWHFRQFSVRAGRIFVEKSSRLAAIARAWSAETEPGFAGGAAAGSTAAQARRVRARNKRMAAPSVGKWVDHRE